MFKKITLPNKLRIITTPMKGTNTVTVLVLCGTGSDNETNKEAGISHFLEHMFFKGTKKRPTPQIIKGEMNQMGGIQNAFTSHEITGYYIKTAKTRLDRALEILADIYINSLLDQKEIDRERQVVIEEMHMIADTPERQVGIEYEKLLYGNQNAGRDISGTEEHIRSFTPKHFKDYFNRQYTAQNTAVVVAGNCDESYVTRKVLALFSKVRATKPKPFGSFRELRHKNPQTKVIFKETDQTHILLGFRGIPGVDKDRYVADMLATVLGGSWSSRMFDTVRERLGLAYHIATDHSAYSNRGCLVTYAGVAHSNVERATAAIMGEYSKMIERGVNVSELTRTKEYIKTHTLIAMEASNAVANFVGSEEMLTGKPLTIDEVFAKIDAVTPAQVQALAKKLFRPERLNLAIIGPFKDEEKFKKLLKL
ncbi:MAG: insulinase family protein [Candidatus Sungbacteria bacterium]|nr:insulinase family protein [Candidatus Sungbacteria bacterium]